MSKKIKEEHESSVWKNGFDEGYIFGMQEMVYRMTEAFFNTKEAKKYKLNKFSAELTDVKIKKEDIIKFDKYTNASWIGAESLEKLRS